RLRIADRLFQRTALEQHAEFIAAQARHRVPPAGLGCRECADLSEPRSAGAGPAVVVAGLEVVEVEVTERKRRLARAGARDPACPPRLELEPVDQLGEDVVTRVIRQLAVELATLADVMEHQDAAAYRTLAVAYRRGAALDVHLVAVAADQQGGTHRLDGARATDRHSQRILERLAGLLMEAAEDLVDAPALRMLQAPPGELLRDRIEILDAALRVGGDDAVAYRLQRDLRALLLLEERFLEELALGDVQVHADDAPRPALLVDARFRAAHHPEPHAVAVPEPMHALEHRL